MKQGLNRNRRFFIHDYDGVHYDYAAFGDVYAFLAGIKVEAVGLLLPDLDPADVHRMGTESYKKYGDGLKMYVDIADSRGFDRKEFRTELHVLYNRICHQRTLEQYPAVFDPCRDTNSAFDLLRPHAKHGVLTLGCVDNWTKPLLTRQNRLQYFEPHALIGFAETGFVNKADSTEPLRMVMDLLGAKPQETVFFEDSLPNLKRAKELDERICNVYICHGTPLENLPDFVDIQVSKPHHLMMSAARIFTPPAQKWGLSLG